MMVELDHVVIHIDDWDACIAVYADVLEAELVENPEAAGSSLPAFAYRSAISKWTSTGLGPAWTGRAARPR